MAVVVNSKATGNSRSAIPGNSREYVFRKIPAGILLRSALIFYIL